MASRYDGRSDAPTITRRRHVLACARCRARRVKCDRAQPACSNCVKVGALCQAVQQPNPQHASLPSRPGSREPVDHNRLYKLEEEVARLSREVDSKSPSREPSYSPPPVEATEGQSYVRHGGTVKGRGSTYISPYSWAAAAEEVIRLETVLGEGMVEHGGQSTRDLVHEDVMPMVDDRLHEILLGVYGQRVDPIVRVLHWPTFLQKCRIFRQGALAHVQTTAASTYPGAYAEASPAATFANPASLLPQRGAHSKSSIESASIGSTFVAVLYSVYFAAMASICHSSNPPDLGQNVNNITLWSTFQKEVSTRIGLADGKYIRTESVEMLQAMVLYMSVEIGTSDPQLQWQQLGTAIRMAQSLGMHRDPVDFGFDAIEIETRRRLWAQICILDARLAEHLCREPTIAPASYDTILPLSISDQDLFEILQHKGTADQGREMHLQVLQEVEQAQEHTSPFSSMTFMLVEAEMARQQQQLLCFQYQPRDRALSANSSPQMAKGATQAGGRTDRAQSTNELRNRFSIRYNCDRLDCSDPMQYLVSELCQINLMKVKFINRSSQGRAAMIPTSTPSEHSEITGIFHDALRLATRCAALSHQYSSSPYNWYTRRIREVYSSSFLAMVLASDHPIGREDTDAAWAVLDQLFAPDASGNIIEPGVRDTLLGKVLAKARAKRGSQLQTPIPHHIREQAMHPPTGSYPPQLLPHPAATSSANSGLGHTNSFQPSGNLFEDWDVLMQEPAWPGGIPVTDTNYWSSALPPSSIPGTSSRPPPRPYEQRAYSQHPSYQQQILPIPPVLPSDYKAHPQRHLPTIDLTLTSRKTEPLPSAYIGTVTQWSPTPTPSANAFPQMYAGEQAQDEFITSAALSPSRTWPTPLHEQLQIPRGNNRERSNSQPAYSSHSRTPSEGQMKRRSASNLSDRPDSLQLGFR